MTFGVRSKGAAQIMADGRHYLGAEPMQILSLIPNRHVVALAGIAFALFALSYGPASAAPRASCSCSCLFADLVQSCTAGPPYNLSPSCQGQRYSWKFATREGCNARKGQYCRINIGTFNAPSYTYGVFVSCIWGGAGSPPEDAAPPPDGVSPAGPKKPRPGGGVVPPSN